MTRPEWETRHIEAFVHPRGDERDLVTLCKIANSLINRGMGQDYVLRDAIADLLLGARQLLNAEWGQRLDMGSVDAFIVKLASRIGYNLDTETFQDAG